MLTRRLIFAALCVAGPCAPAARADLTLTQRVEGLGQNTENTSRFKDGKTRVDTSPGTSLIMDLKTGETISLNHPQKTFLRLSGDLTKAAAESIRSTQAAHPDARTPLTATGRRETVGSYAAEEYTCTVAGVKIALWLTKDLPGFQAALKELSDGFKTGPLAAMMQNYGFDLTTLPGFPVRTTLEVQPGQTMTRTVTALSTQPLPESDFEVPAGYTEINAKTLLTPPAAAQGLPAVVTPSPTGTP